MITWILVIFSTMTPLAGYPTLADCQAGKDAVIAIHGDRTPELICVAVEPAGVTRRYQP